ncbi:MAG TPA: hypothetical protein VFT84_04175 [Gemmatimonadales bacterium]|nr:hypothetical protein [Gemmatimonadales bacterium]
MDQLFERLRGGLWDKADSELQGRVAEAREALRRLTEASRP